MTHLLILEDIPETRAWLCEIALAAFPGCTVREESTVRGGLTAASAEAFDLAMIDLGLPDGSGLDVLRRLKDLKPETVCIVTTIMGDDAWIVGALSAGANGYLLKDQPKDILTRQLQQIADGVPALSPSIARRIMDHFRLTGPAAPEESLTPRERDVLALIGRGMRNNEVARSLGLSDNTVAGYIKGIYRKLGISSRAEASWHATRMGLTPGGERA
ncbi:LuxR C-terminal-related transcriptional regulator [Hyphomonas sp.]|uniref:LuxR C-terminal-related transcriptional regulator n=1 Tax=Hyphomonas sp. TaxID=87 RepID=UPI00391A467B